MARKIDLTAMNVPRAKKGEAVPMSVADTSPQPGGRAGGPAPAQEAAAPDLVAAPAEPPAPPAADLTPRKARERGEPRSPVTTRLTYSLQDRLFRAATILGKSQQALIEEAIDGLLRKHKL